MERDPTSFMRSYLFANAMNLDLLSRGMRENDDDDDDDDDDKDSVPLGQVISSNSSFEVPR